jgi:hypothetical protein
MLTSCRSSDTCTKPRDSCITSDHDNVPPVPQAELASKIGLDEETQNGEHSFGEYGGDLQHNSKLDKSATSREDEGYNLVTWDGLNDPDNPKNWSTRYRWLLTALCCISTLNVYVFALHDFTGRLTRPHARTFASSAPTSALKFIAKDLNISVEVSNLMSKNPIAN